MTNNKQKQQQQQHPSSPESSASPKSVIPRRKVRRRGTGITPAGTSDDTTNNNNTSSFTSSSPGGGVLKPILSTFFSYSVLGIVIIPFTIVCIRLYNFQAWRTSSNYDAIIPKKSVASGGGVGRGGGVRYNNNKKGSGVGVMNLSRKKGQQQQQQATSLSSTTVATIRKQQMQKQRKDKQQTQNQNQNLLKQEQKEPGQKKRSSPLSLVFDYDVDADDDANKIIPRAYEARWRSSSSLSSLEQKKKNTNTTELQLPCYPPESDMFTKKLPAKEGFIFVKTYKTGSSTASGINLRIARNVAQRLHNSADNNITTSDNSIKQTAPTTTTSTSKFDTCKARFDHAPAYKKYSGYNPKRTVLWTVLREPTKRFVSQFFHFMVTRRSYEPTVENLRHYITEGNSIHVNMVDHHYLNFLSFTPRKQQQQQKQLRENNNNAINAHANETTNNPIQIINQIVQDYDFIAITERMDESAVVLSMLLNIPLSDVLYLKAKGNGGYDDAGGGDLTRTCKVIQSSFITSDMQNELESKEWQRQVKYDRLLYEAANRSLDMTIEHTIGREKFEKQLQLYKTASQKIDEVCASKAIFPCTDGVYHNESQTDCIWNDSACGMECIDEVAKEMNI